MIIKKIGGLFLYQLKFNSNYYITKSGDVYSRKYKLLTCKSDKDGYRRISLSNNGKCKGYFIHRIVAMMFIPNPHNKKTVNHKNGIKWDNILENLEWCTISENIQHAYDTKLKSWSSKSGRPKKPVDQYDLKLNFVCSYTSMAEAERVTGINHRKISKSYNGEQKTAGRFIWRPPTINNI